MRFDATTGDSPAGRSWTVSDAARLPRPPLTTTATRPRPDACLVRLAGELDLDTAPMLGAYLRTHTAVKPTYLLLDLYGVNFLAAAGLTVIVTAQRDDHSIHGDLRVIGVPSNRAVARVLHLTGIDTSLRIHPTVADALDALDTITQN